MSCFQKMKKKLEPTTATLNALLNVYAHADRVNTAIRCLGLYKVHNVKPDSRYLSLSLSIYLSIYLTISIYLSISLSKKKIFPFTKYK